jgi:OOP family OmpA-OmpF porin
MKLFTTLFILFFTITAFAKTGIYVNAATGWSNQPNFPTASEANAYKTKVEYFPIIRVGVGYMHYFNSTFGLGFELGQGYYGKTTYYFNNGGKFSARSRLLDFLAVFAMSFNKFDLHAKLGGNRHTITTAKYADIQPELIAGAAYNFNNHFAIILDYLHSFQQRNNEDDISSKDDFVAPGLNAILAGIRITFF